MACMSKSLNMRRHPDVLDRGSSSPRYHNGGNDRWKLQCVFFLHSCLICISVMFGVLTGFQHRQLPCWQIVPGGDL